MSRVTIPDDDVIQPLIAKYTELAAHYRQSARDAERIAANMIHHLQRWEPDRARHYQQWSDALIQRFLAHAKICEQSADALIKAFATHQTAHEHAKHLLKPANVE